IFSGHPMKTKEPSDENTYYMKDYVSRNASDTCTWRLGGDCMDSYGDANLKMVFISDDGQKINDKNISFYRVVEQNIEPNTELKLTESGWITEMNYEEITLRVQVSAAGKKVASKTERKTGQLKRYECEAKDNSVVTKFVSKNDSEYLSSSSYDVVECAWDETTYYLE
ncbi:hypothetical protein IKG20_01435, partial [Candidatus Saccharibacteria bacterium]|nr:hypothetical protein [Candidatus Saccharibacteria bacterium]